MALEAPLHRAPPRGKYSRRRGQGKVSCQAAPAPRCPVPQQGQPRLLRCRARRLQPAKQPSRGQRSRLRARPPPSARRPRSRPGTAGARRRGARLGAGGRAPARAWRTGVAQPQSPSSSQRTLATCQCAPAVAPGGRGWGSGDSATPPFLAPAGAPAGRAAAAHPPSPPAGGARGGQALGPRAARRPPHLPRGARVSPPGHSPPQLSVLCSPAGNDLRKRLGQGLRQAAGARRGDVLGSRLPINYGWKQIRESQFCKSPRSGPGGVLRPGGSRRAAGRRRQRDEQEGRETFISS